MFVVPYNSQSTLHFDVPDADLVIKKNIMRGGVIVTEKDVWTSPSGRTTDIVATAPDGSYVTSNGMKLPASPTAFTRTTRTTREVIDVRTVQETRQSTRKNQWYESKREKIPYFTDIFISRDSKERARFLFGFDMLTYLRNNCTYPALLKDSQVLSKVATKIDINSLKLTKTRKGSSKIEPNIIVESKSESPGAKLSSRTYSERKLTRKDKIGSDVVDALITKGTISEISFDTLTPLGIRYFSGIDETSRKDTSGEFEYTVTIEISDPTIGALKEFLDRTRILYGVFNNYYTAASQGNYNTTAKRFKERFIIEFDNNMEKEIAASLKEYVRLVSFLDHSSVKNMSWQNLYRMIHPRKSSPSLIRHFLSTVESNISVMQRDYDSTRTGSTNKSLKNSTRAIKQNLGSENRLLRVEKTFETTYNANSVEKYCQKIFNLYESRRAALASINKNAFVTRRQMEFDKYFRNIPTTLTVDGIQIAASPGNEYFSPIELLFGEDRKVECGHIPKDTDELQNQNNSIFHISDYNNLEKISHARRVPTNQSNFNVQLKRRRDIDSTELVSEIDEKTTFKGLDSGNVLRLNQERQRQYAVANKIKKITTISRMTDKNNRVVDKSYYDLRNPAGGIRISTQCPPDNITLDSLPIQTKALIIDSSKGAGGTIANYASKQENFGWFYQNFIGLYKVEALVGYERSQEGLQIKRPIFKSLTGMHLRDQKTYLCRLTKESSKKLGRPNIEELDYPIYNQYFLLTPSRTPIAVSPGTSAATTTPVTTTMTTTY